MLHCKRHEQFPYDNDEKLCEESQKFPNGQNMPDVPLINPRKNLLISPGIKTEV